MIRTIKQERAKFCLACVKRIKLATIGKWQENLNGEFYEVKIDSLEKLKDFYNKSQKIGGIWVGFMDFFISQILKNKKSLLEKLLKDALNDQEKNELSTLVLNKLLFADFIKEYGSHAKRLPQMIVSNGLISTLAFYKAKSKERRQIYNDLTELMELLFRPYKEWKIKNPEKGLIEFLIEGDANILRLATIETLALAEWLKRIVEMEIKTGGTLDEA